MFTGFTSFCNETWVSFYDNKPARHDAGGHEIKWKRVFVDELPIEHVSFERLRQLIREYDEFYEKEKNNGMTYTFEKGRPFGHDSWNNNEIIQWIRLYLQYRMMAISEPLEEMNLEASVEKMRERILNNITRTLCHNSPYASSNDRIC
jgi:hypothetical protein